MVGFFCLKQQMNFFKRIFSFICSCLLLNTCISQSYNFKNYSTEQGLPQSQVLSIFQDSLGYMWFGTNGGGVSKFNGSSFKTYSMQDGLFDNTINAIGVNNKNQILFGTAAGLNLFNGKKIFKINKKINAVYSLLFDGNKTWVGSSKGVYILKEDSLIEFYNKNKLLNTSTVRSIYIDKRGNIWFGTTENGVIVFNSKSKTFKYFNKTNGLMANFVFSFSENNAGSVLIGTSTGLNKVDAEFNITEANEIPLNINIAYSSIVKNTNDEFYFGTYSEGIINFDFKINKRYKNFDIHNGLVNNPIVALFKDRENNLWIGTDGSGVFKYNSEKFTYYTKSMGLAEEFISAVANDVNNNLWIACKGNGVVKKNKTEFTTYKLELKNPYSLPDNDVNAILPLQNGSVLFGTKEGLCIYENNQFKTYKNELIRHKYILRSPSARTRTPFPRSTSIQSTW